MLALQKFLIEGGNPKDLALRVYHHQELPLIGYKYSSDSPKKNPIVDNARGIVLDEQHQLIMKGFNRFYNYGQHEDYPFDWNNFICQEKCDGSLILVKQLPNGHTLINTSGSFGYGTTSGISIKTFRELFLEVFPHLNCLQSWLTFAFELCSLENKVVQTHINPHVKLLSVFHGSAELPINNVASIANEIGVPLAEIYKDVKSIADVNQLMEKKLQENPLFEGFVFRDKNNQRLKLKSLPYLLAHQMGTGQISKSTIIEWILNSDDDMVLETFPEHINLIKPYEDSINELLEKVNGIYSQVKNITDQKEFALAIKHHKFSGILFTMRAKGIGPRQFLLDNLSYAEKILT